jgi:hypothetical protein
MSRNVNDIIRTLNSAQRTRRLLAEQNYLHFRGLHLI